MNKLSLLAAVAFTAFGASLTNGKDIAARPAPSTSLVAGPKVKNIEPGEFQKEVIECADAEYVALVMTATSYKPSQETKKLLPEIAADARGKLKIVTADFDALYKRGAPGSPLRAFVDHNNDHTAIPVFIFKGGLYMGRASCDGADKNKIESMIEDQLGIEGLFSRDTLTEDKDVHRVAIPDISPVVVAGGPVLLELTHSYIESSRALRPAINALAEEMKGQLQVIRLDSVQVSEDKMNSLDELEAMNNPFMRFLDTGRGGDFPVLLLYDKGSLVATLNLDNADIKDYDKGRLKDWVRSKLANEIIPASAFTVVPENKTLQTTSFGNCDKDIKNDQGLVLAVWASVNFLDDPGLKTALEKMAQDADGKMKILVLDKDTLSGWPGRMLRRAEGHSQRSPSSVWLFYKGQIVDVRDIYEGMETKALEVWIEKMLNSTVDAHNLFAPVPETGGTPGGPSP
jgi:thiol-disulfide isomerase/thioredoxin